MADSYKLVLPADQVSIAEQVGNIVTESMSDSMSLAEAISKIASIFGLADSQTFAEAMTSLVAVGKTDSQSITESVMLALGVNVGDTVSQTEAKTINLDKILADAVTFADSDTETPFVVEPWWSKIKYMSACHGGI